MPAPLRFRDERRAAAAASRLRVAIVEARERLQAGDVRRERELAVAEREGRERIRTPERRVVPADERVAIDSRSGGRTGSDDERSQQDRDGAAHRGVSPFGGNERSIRRSGTSQINATPTKMTSEMPGAHRAATMATT